ncbi:hypothetical protein LH47_02084 [Anoxybacillus thermarum]|uniref:Uncharacterized protein n=1 Tax=Anoxybacillus thermarum TaxID=404937 RepID=A0A0D0Q772_9BACL|nr:hypothetical protein LH47_02084 [Anoxybacillus thermarum]
MVSILGNLRCPICRETFKRQDKVVLDIINKVIHWECYYTCTERELFPIQRRMVASEDNRDV